MINDENAIEFTNIAANHHAIDYLIPSLINIHIPTKIRVTVLNTNVNRC